MTKANRRSWWVALPLALLLALSAYGCAGLANVLGVQEPRFAMAGGRESQLRVSPPSPRHPRGAATVRIWTRVENPNAFGLTLSVLQGTLALEGEELADVDLPLGLPLSAAADTVIPLEITFDFGSFSALGSVAQRLLTRGEVLYELNGTLGVDAGPLGEPRFGPRTWLRGELDVATALGGVR